jgi:hypothetical protein
MNRMKGMLLSFVMVFVLIGVSAQTQDWVWANCSTNGDSWVQDISTDNLGNSYVTGYFSFTVSFGITTLTNYGGSDIFVAKMDSLGNWLWAISVASTGVTNAYCIATDNEGNSCVTGSFGGAASFGAFDIYMAYGYTGLFVAKIDSNGNWLWAKTASSQVYGDSHTGQGVSLDSNRNCYVTGWFQGLISFGSITLGSVGAQQSLFIAKLDVNGNWQWAKMANGLPTTKGEHIITDPDGNSYVTGYFNTQIDIGSISLINIGQADVFIAKIDTNGIWIWAKQIGSVNDDNLYDISMDNAENIYITGNIQGTTNFGGYILSCESQDLYVAKLDSNGNWIWAISAGGTHSDCGLGIAADYMGICFVTGYFQGNATFGGYILTSDDNSGYSDAFISKLDSNGNWIWAKKAGGMNGYDRGIAVATDNIGNCFLTGEYYQTTSFGNVTLPNGGTPGTFVAKLSAPSIYEITLLTNQSMNFGSVYIEEESDYQTVKLYNSGYQNISISNIHFIGNPKHFEIISPFRDISISPCNSDSIMVRFTPHTVGTISDTLYIVNNSMNQPLLKIRLSGIGLNVLPKPPQNLTATMYGHDVYLVWNPVVENMHDQPITTDYYFVFSSDKPYGGYVYHGATSSLSYTLPMVGLFQPRMFYKVRAYKYYGRGAFDISELDLKQGMREEDILRVIHDR